MYMVPLALPSWWLAVVIGLLIFLALVLGSGS
jgi:hypothetical protein